MFERRQRERHERTQSEAAGSSGRPQQLGSMTLAVQKLNQMEALHVRSLAASVAPPTAVAPRSRPGRRRLQKLHSSMYPQGPGNNDRSAHEHVVNVMTAVPFIIVGCSLCRDNGRAEGRRFGASLVLAGAAAMGYHALPKGRARSCLRKLDHWTISLATSLMVPAICPDLTPAARRLSTAALVAVPFRPTTVTVANIGFAEYHFARAAAVSPRLRPQWRRHVTALAGGAACFAAENAAIARGIDLLHPLWHCLACYAVAGTSALMPRDSWRSTA